ncbi:uncharacterized protein N7473_008666 [Penicillium subrubescens]|uniref:uncharacterized protein n=1 Tax=Penicillium subrubescens TaxID=1316194 RepID=UPI002544FBAC|nr:uncharacterized protein N7473_008666 [Penicillium subrubescens]KAJ5885992.1 hypothetical protein N7473_008666 [Penicillium subrubescens]
MSLFVISSKEIQDLKEAEIVEFEPKDDIQEELDFLRQDFRSRREKLRSGILGNVFLLLTDKARLSCGTEGAEMFYSYDGRLKINLTQVF